MKKIADITAYLLSLDLVRSEQVESYVDEPKIIPSGRSISDDVEGTENGIILFRQTYTATLNFNDFPHGKHPAEMLFAQVCAWLLTNDPDRDEIAQPEIDIEIKDNDTADIEISIDFEEDVNGVEDPAGTILLWGKTYRLADPVINYAETGDVST